MKKITLSIGIAAYNEETNIIALVHSIQRQKTVSEQIKEIIIVSDGSTDKTEDKVKSIKDKRIRFVVGAKRSGKVYRLNQIFKMFKGEVLILVDADCVLRANSIKAIADKFQRKSDLGLLGCKSIPLSSNKISSPAILSSIAATNYVRKHWNKGINIFGFSGRLMALSRSFAKQIRVPKTFGDDTYIYLEAKKRNVLCDTSNVSACYYQIPATISDHLKQSIRFSQAKKELIKIFGSSTKTEYEIPTSILIKAASAEFVKNPVDFAFYCIILQISRLLATRFKNRKITWVMAQSTKKLNI